MVSIKEKIRRFFYPFEKPLTVVLVGNDPIQSGRLMQQMKETLEAPSGYFTKLKEFEVGNYSGEQDEKVYFFRQPHSLMSFTLHVAADIDDVYAQKGRTGIDLLMVSISFSDTKPHIHDETDKYDIIPIIEKCKRVNAPQVSLLTINETLLKESYANSDKTEICADLNASLFECTFSQAGRYLNEKGSRQLYNVIQEQLNSNRDKYKRAKTKAKTVVLYNDGVLIENTDHFYAFFLLNLFKRNKWSNYAIY